MSSNNNASFIWSIAIVLRNTSLGGSKNGETILPMTVLRRFDCILDENREQVQKYLDKGAKPDMLVAKYGFYNKTKHTLTSILDDPANIRENLIDYVEGFSDDVKDIFDNFEMVSLINKLDKNDVLFEVVRKFTYEVDLHPDVVSNADMGSMFEELIHKFTDSAASEDGEFFTPRDAIKLLTRVLVSDDIDILKTPGIIRSVYDPTVGTGGMLSVAEETIKALNPKASLNFFGQELNDNSYAICKSDMMIKGQPAENIRLGNTLTNDLFDGEQFDYAMSNPPYGTDWKRFRKEVEAEANEKGLQGRFGYGLPPVSDGQLLFLCHLVSKMKPVEEGGSRIGIVMNGSSLFSGGAGSGASDIRRYMFENDLVEAIIGLPTNMFYNTGISTYIWILDNTKRKERIGKVQLINAANIFHKTRKSLGEKSREFNDDDIDLIEKLYMDFAETEESKIFDNEAMGYSEVETYLPKKLMFSNNSEKRSELIESTSVQKLKTEQLDDLKNSLEALPDNLSAIHSFDEVSNLLKNKSGKSPSQSVINAFVNIFGEDDSEAEVFLDKKGEPAVGKKDSERVELTEDIEEYFEREVYPYAADTKWSEDKIKIGYEVPFTRLFYKYVPPRSVTEIDNDINSTVKQITTMLADLEGSSVKDIIEGE